MKYIMGIDPGQEGYIALLAVDGKRNLKHTKHLLIPTPSNSKGIAYLELYDVLKKYSNDIVFAVIEDQWGRPGMNAKSVFQIGANWGRLESALLHAGIMVDEAIPPTTWQKAVRDIYKDQTEYRDKDLSIYAAKLTIPFFDPLPRSGKTERSKEDHNAADALLIAYYGYMLYKEG